MFIKLKYVLATFDCFGDQTLVFDLYSRVLSVVIFEFVIRRLGIEPVWYNIQTESYVLKRFYPLNKFKFSRHPIQHLRFPGHVQVLK